MNTRYMIGTFSLLATLYAGAYDLPPCTVPMNIGVQMKTDTFNEVTLREVHGLGFRVLHPPGKEVEPAGEPGAYAGAGIR